MPIDPISLSAGAKALLFLRKYWAHILLVVMTAAVCWFIWSWYERGKDIKELKASAESKDAVIDLTSERQVREVEIGNETDKRIEALEQNHSGDTTRMSPAVRSAIDSLY